MSRRVGAGTEIALHNLAGHQRYNDHMFGFHRIVRDAGRIDDQVAAGAIHAAGVAPGLNDQSFANQMQIRLAHFLFQFLKHDDG